MIGYISGKIVLLSTDFCLVETNNGIGYRVFMTGSGLSRLEKDKDVKLFIYTSVREDAILLYGFFDYDEYNLFIKLITVSGIGPKVALGMLAGITPDAFRLCVLNQDVKALTKLPGVGKKTAERLLLELRDKLGFSAEEKNVASLHEAVVCNGNLGVKDEALQALLALGYENSEIVPALKNIKEDMPVEDVIKAVLKSFAGR